MRVLFVNSRPDADENPGGDNIQMLKTKAALEAVGVTVHDGDINHLESSPDCDLAHVFNIQTPQSTQAVFSCLHKKGVPIILSPIYWDMYEYWGELAVQYRNRWRVLAERFGKRRVIQIYINWQRLKSPLKASWRIQRQLLEQALLVLPNSNAEGNLLKNSFRLNNHFLEKIRLVPNGIEFSYYSKLPQPSRAFYEKYGIRDFVLQVGTINPVKNQLGLIEALYDLPIDLVFIGKVLNAYSEYGNACRALGMKRGRVVFIDRIPHEDLPGTYALAAVHALPSWRETPGLVSLEAGAAGCQVVTTSIGSTREYFKDQAWYCYPSEKLSISSAVESALSTKNNLELRERILNEYTWQKAGEQTLAAYLEVLQR